MQDKGSSFIKVGTYTESENPIVFPRKKVVFGEEIDNYLQMLLEEKVNNNEYVPEDLLRIFSIGES